MSTLGNDPQVISAAAQLVAAEQNFNPFAVSVPSLCSDVSLPATVALRGIVPLVDPAVIGSDVENANSAASLQTPLDATGLSVADVATANGFSNFTAQAAGGAAGAAAGGAGNTGNAAGSAGNAANTAPSTTNTAAVVPAAGGNTSANTGASANTGNAVQQSSVAGLDFGQCVPTVKFEAGLNGRKDTEFTFQAVDPLVNKGQQEALNPAIIFNRVCDQLTNVCNANQAAKDACEQAKTDLGDSARDVTTADAWNTQLGFAGADTNPDNAPQAGLVGHA